MNMGARVGGKDGWMTPPYILERINAMWVIWFDPCPVSPIEDGLTGSWCDHTYVNPPFSQYPAWATHGLRQPGAKIWMCHHSHDTRWFQLLMTKMTAICLLTERVRFIDPATNQPAGTAIGKCQSLIYHGEEVEKFREIFSKIGKCLI